MKHFFLFSILGCLAFSAHAQLNISQGETNPGNNGDQCMNIERSNSGTFYIYSSYPHRPHWLLKFDFYPTPPYLCSAKPFLGMAV